MTVSQLIEVAFKGNRKEFFLWEADEPPLRAPVIVDADRGEDLGLVHATGLLAEQRSAHVPHGLLGAPPTHVAKRLATADDVRRLEEVRAQDDDARRRAMERVKANALVMKVTDAEWQWDRKKLTFYFTAEKRVDFRTLVRELASMFRTRIELKQIGVRDEAKRLDGIGRCGRQYCSASWLPELRPVNLGVAKDQRLSLNPSQISGACGRLMCCLRYEHEFYVQSRKKYPKEGKPVRTSRGEEKVLANDIFRERVTLRGLDGEVRSLPLATLREEMLAAGDALAQALAHAAAAAELAAAVPTPEQTIEDDEISPEEALDTEHSPDHLTGIGAAIDPSLDVTMEWPTPRPAPDGRRPQRRRGRRGGRRNRPGGGEGTRAPEDEGAPSEGD
ncbi:MAG TPA: regulatory iron-sulfur-containing complex subunit RicT [Gemmatimonadaceae bacterium]|nr:regulatory iron-sulfur-containing complex subunit RicT [Gemmatimonadaceae bacterium]